ncbi:uncharacterized protein TNCV_836041 [Trichonephila clavipes]|nr:uncharacterized protein TNCV_836041 [Trichonephila clavipes]
MLTKSLETQVPHVGVEGKFGERGLSYMLIIRGRNIQVKQHASTITLLVQRFRDKESVADRKRSGRASIQDGATCHTSRDSIEVLNEFFDDGAISKGLWPPLLPDLSIQDFFLWGYLKNVTYRNNPHTLDELKSDILHAMSDINSHSS